MAYTLAHAIYRQLRNSLMEISEALVAQQQVVRAPLGRIATVAREACVEAPSTLVVGAVVDVLVAPASVSDLREAIATP